MQKGPSFYASQGRRTAAMSHATVAPSSSQTIQQQHESKASAKTPANVTRQSVAPVTVDRRARVGTEENIWGHSQPTNAKSRNLEGSSTAGRSSEAATKIRNQQLPIPTQDGEIAARKRDRSLEKELKRERKRQRKEARKEKKRQGKKRD